MKIKNKKKIFPYLLTIFLAAGLFLLAAPVSASNWAADVIGGLLGLIIGGLGLILALVMQALVAVAQYSNFIHAPAITNGWVVVRDVCNMFFVLILLIIAFATILKVENYSYKKWLPKLILMAILINFSKTICGLLIDFAQVVMLTFVNAFKDMAAGNLVTSLGIQDILTLADNSEDVGFWEIIGAYLLGLIYIIVALVVVVTMLAMLVMRIVMIWIYVVLSPAAYLMSAFPGGQKYASQWWSEFSKNLIVGPVLAFFIWLSFVSLQAQNISGDFPTSNSSTSQVASEVGISGPGGSSASSSALAASQASTPGVFIKFIIAIGMLIGGLKISQEIGGAAGGIAGKGMGTISKGAMFAGGLATGALAFGGKKIKQGVGKGVGIVGMNLADKSKGVLGKIAASSNPALRFTGARALATGGLVAINRKQKEIEEKAQKKIDSVRNAEVVARYAREGAITPEGKAIQRKAANMMPSALGDATKITEKLAGMGREDLAKLSDAEWHAVGQSGAQLQGRALSYVQKNSDERGAYNLGIDDHNNNQVNGPQGINANLAARVIGTDKSGNPIQGNDAFGSYVNQTRVLHPDEQQRLRREGKYSTFYFKDEPKIKPETTTKVDAGKVDEPRGNGNLSVNDFARQKSDTVAVDFDKLDIKGIDKGADKDNRNVRGVNTSDPAMIKEVSAKMVGMIDSELNMIRSKGANITPGDQKRMGNLEGAKARFSNPKGIDNISMVNSSAASYKLSDVKKSKIHEEVHGLGVEDEKEAREVTQTVLDTKAYDVNSANGGRTTKDTVDKIRAERQDGKTETAERRPVKDVLKDEKTSAEESVTVNTENLDKSMDNFSKKIDEISQKFNVKPVAGASQAKTAQPNFVYLFGSLKKAITGDNRDLVNKISRLGGGEASTPLEVKAISEQVGGDINKK